MFPAWFAIVVGVAMIVQWTLSFLSHRIPELTTEPIQIWFHIAGEMLTAAVLITSGVALLAGRPGGTALFLVGMGMLFYTAIVSPGYFAQRGQWPWLVVFGALILLGLVSIALLLS